MRATAESLALWIAAAIVVVAPLPLGGTPLPAKVLLAALVGLGLSALVFARDVPAHPPRTLAFLTLLTLALALVYVVPLPFALVESLSPRVAEAAQASLVAPGQLEPGLAAADEALMLSVGVAPERPSWRPLAADPDAAWEGGLRLAASLGAFLLALLAVRGPKDRRLLVAALAVSAFLQAASGIAGHFSGDGTLLPLDKNFYPERATGTFVNPNHFGTLLFLGLFSLVGILATGGARDEENEDEALPTHRRARLSALATLGGVIVVALLWSMSRAALSCTALGLFAFLVFGLSVRRTMGRRLLPPLVLGLIAAMLVAGAVWLKPPDPVLDRFAATSEALPDRVRLWKGALDVAADYPLVGVGLGALRHVEPQYRPPDMGTRAIHAHNDYVEWLAETGAPGALLLLAWTIALVVSVVLLLRLPRERAMSAALAAGILALALHEVVDFSLQLLGVSLPAAVMLGALLAPLARRGPSREAPHSAAPFAWKALVPVAGGIVFVLAFGCALQSRPLPPLPTAGETPREFRLRSADTLRTWARAEVSYVTARAASENPLDRGQAERRLASALRAARSALARAPLRAETHLTVWVASQSLSGARLPDPPSEGFVELMRHHLARAEELAPSSRARLLQLVRYWLLAGDTREARRIARRLLEMRPVLYREIYELLGGSDLDLGQLMEATPNRPDAAYHLAAFMRSRRDDVGATIVLERALARHPESLRLRRALADVLAARGETRAALELLPQEEVDGDPVERLRILRLRANLMIREKRFDALEALVRQQIDAGEDPYLLAQQEARSLVAQGDAERAIASLQRTLERREPPMSQRMKLSLLLQLGRLLEVEDRHRDALDVFRQAAGIEPDHPSVKAYFERLDKALQGS